MSAPHVKIIGAGIGGLATALSLLRAGYRVSVREQSTTLRELGAGLTLSPNANHALNHLGLEATMARIGSVPRSAGVQHYQSGAVLVDVSRNLNPRDQYGADYLMTHRADLHDALLSEVSKLGPSCVQLGRQFVSYKHIDHGTQAIFADGSAEDSDILLGCDGIHSAVRAQMHGQKSPHFTGYIAWRGLVPLGNIKLPAIEPESAISIGPGRTCTRYLIRPRAQVNYVAVAQRSGWEVEGWSVRSEVTELLEEFAGFHPELRAILAATPADECYKWALCDRDPLPFWTDQHVALLGDAAHPMLPFLGQGAGMAIEDAVVIERALTATGDITSGLKRYEQARLPRTTFVTLESRANIARMQAPDPENYNRESHRNEEALGLFAYNPATVPI